MRCNKYWEREKNRQNIVHSKRSTSEEIKEQRIAKEIFQKEQDIYHHKEQRRRIDKIRIIAKKQLLESDTEKKDIKKEKEVRQKGREKKCR